MSERTYRVLSIGAHPDDADTSAGGLLLKLYHIGCTVRLLSLTDGSAGMYDPERCGEELAGIRRLEAKASGKLVGGDYDVWDIPDGRLSASIENRERLIGYIREFAPDLILTHRPQDCHPDHRSTAQLVADASYLLTVPYIVRDVPALTHMPVILYWHDGFTRPRPIAVDVIVPIDEVLEERVLYSCCHASQYFDWMYWPDEMEKKDWPREAQIEDRRRRNRERAARDRAEADPELTKRLGAETAARIHAVEIYEICEYGSPLPEDLRRILES